MISKENIKQITEEGGYEGHDIRVRDISYVLLCTQYDSKEIAYKTLFISEDNFKEYEESSKVKFLRKNMEAKGLIFLGAEEDISFKENKAYMLKLKAETEKAMKSGDIPKKDGLKILADLTTKLNDKFGANDTTQEQMVIVNHKYETICEYCGHEIPYREWTKEEAMEKWNLIENKDE